jgi:FkbM family methyltransferase
MNMLQCIAWLGYRRFRLLKYSLLGRNPLNRKDSVLPLRDEWASVKGLLKANQKRPTFTETDAEERCRWETSAGAFWMPRGSKADFIGMLAAEIDSNVYTIDGIEPLGPASVVLDCGANVGFFSRHALKAGAGKVVAFEPSPETAFCLRRNLAPELASGRAIVVEKGLWDSETELSFSAAVKVNPGSHHVVEGSTGDTVISVTTIDRAVEELGLSQVNYIKMDIEGSELRALRGAQNTIRRHRPVCSIATEHTDDLFANAEAVIQAMRAIDSHYRYICTEAHAYVSPSRGKVLTPYAMLFTAT